MDCDIKVHTRYKASIMVVCQPCSHVFNWTKQVGDHPDGLYSHMKHRKIFNLMRNVAISSSITQFVLLIVVMFTGYPGVYLKGEGFMYISDNFCYKQWAAILFMLSTLPTWVILSCSVALETDPVKRFSVLFMISLPLPLGVGIALFSICTIPTLHYIYVNAFVLSVAFVHLIVTTTARHFRFLQTYVLIVVVSSLCGVSFMVLAVSTDQPGIQKNTAVILEYISMFAFIVLNSLSADRVREHVDK